MFATSNIRKQVVTVFPRKDSTAGYGAIELNVEVIRCCAHLIQHHLMYCLRNPTLLLIAPSRTVCDGVT